MKKLLLATTLFSFIALTTMVSCIKEDPTSAPTPSVTDSLTIISVTPATGLTETSTTFTVNVKYYLQSSDQGQLNIAFNNGTNVATYDRIESAAVTVAKGAGTHTFTVTTTAKKWAAPNKSYVNVGLANYPHGATFNPVAGDSQELTFVP